MLVVYGSSSPFEETPLGETCLTQMRDKPTPRASIAGPRENAFIYISKALLTCTLASIPEHILFVKWVLDLYNKRGGQCVPLGPTEPGKEVLSCPKHLDSQGRHHQPHRHRRLWRCVEPWRW